MYIPWLTSVCGGSYISIYIYILVMGFIIQLITGEPQLIVLWSPEANLRDGSCHPDRADVHPNRTVPALGSLRGLRRFTAVSLANYSWLLASGRQFGWPAVLVLLGRHGGRTANTWCLVSSSTFSGLFSGKLEISNCNLPINMGQI